jgi:hypothetical protein
MCRLGIYAALCVAVLAVAWGTGIASFPLGVPGEWTWARVNPSEPLGLALAPVLVVAALYVGFVWLGARYIATCRRAGLAAWICGLTLAGFAWLWVAQESAPENYQLSKAAWILYYRGSSGYFSEARDRAADWRRYLGSYEQKMAEGDVLHIGTHPPGLAIALRGMLGLCRSAPWFVDLLEATEPNSVRAAFDELQKREPLSRRDRAVLWLAALLVNAGAALTVIPLFALLTTTCTRRASWQAAAFWPTVPALVIFLPKSDCLFPFLATTFIWLWLEGLSRPSRWCSFGAGIVIWLGLFLSLAFLPVGFLALLAGFWNIRQGSPPGAAPSDGQALSTGRSQLTMRESLAQLIPAAAVASVGFSIPILAAWLFVRINLVNVWWLNFQNHAGFYRQYPRTYWKWLLVNPVEFAVAAGLPLTIFAVWSVIVNLRAAPYRRFGHVWAWLAMFALLWVSGKNMGEAARLWVFLMPFLAWFAGPLFESQRRPGTNPAPAAISARADGSAITDSTWAFGLAAQLVATALLVTQVVGFHVWEVLPVVANMPAP